MKPEGRGHMSPYFGLVFMFQFCNTYLPQDVVTHELLIAFSEKNEPKNHMKQMLAANFTTRVNVKPNGLSRLYLYIYAFISVTK